MWWRVLLFAYVAFFGSVLWLCWAVFQFATGARGRHRPLRATARELEPERVGNCFADALWAWLRDGGQLVVESSPLLPIWRASHAPLGDRGPRYHFAALSVPRSRRARIFHAFLHRGRPVDVRRAKIRRG